MSKVFCTIGLLIGLVATGITAPPDYSAIDRHALSAPPAVTNSIQSLSDYLIKPALTDTEKARAIFRWMTANITYDVAGYLSGKTGDNSAEGTLKSRKSVCAGYGNLFEALASAAGLEVVVISGYARGTGYVPGQTIPVAPNHDWNAVKIDGRWQLIDATWGAGYMIGREYVREFDDFYFLTPPEKLIFDHFPDEPKWQLLRRPVTKKEFDNRPKVWSDFFRYGIGFASYPEINILADGAVTLAYNCPADVIFSAAIIRNGIEQDESLTFVEKVKDGVQIHCLFPEKGAYLLYIFAKRKSEPAEYRSVAAYAVTNQTVKSGPLGFPSTFESFAMHDAVLVAPMEKYLPLGHTVNFQIYVPGASKVAVVAGDQWTHLNKIGEKFSGDVRITNRSVQVFALFPGNESYDGLLEYEGIKK
jgi:transglutaminase/protease-like cytokinesis protein 3